MGEGGAVVEGEDEVGAEVDMQIIKRMVAIQTGVAVVGAVAVVMAIVVLDMVEGEVEVAEAMVVGVVAWVHVLGVEVTKHNCGLVVLFALKLNTCLGLGGCFQSPVYSSLIIVGYLIISREC